MKTTKFFSALILSVIFTGNLTVKGSNPSTGRYNGLQSGSVTYNVNVNWDENIALRNVYLVQITDEYGHLVAQPQRFYPGKNKYQFTERNVGRGKMRIASLVKATWPHHYVSPDELISAPVAKPGPFLIGSTYNFQLYTRKIDVME